MTAVEQAAQVVAEERCVDVHPHRWTGPRAEGPQPDSTCLACRSWGAHVAAALDAAGLLAGPDAAVRARVEAVLDEWGNRLDRTPDRALEFWLNRLRAALEADAGVQAPTSEGDES